MATVTPFWFCLIGNAFNDWDKFSEALKNQMKAMQIRLALGEKKGIATSYNNIGAVYSAQGNYAMALENYFACLKLETLNGKEIPCLKNLGLTQTTNPMGFGVEFI